MIDTLDNPTQHLVSDCNELSEIDSHITLEEAIVSLKSPERPFASFDLIDIGLTKDKMDLLNQIQIKFLEPFKGTFSLECVSTSCDTRAPSGNSFNDIHTYESNIQGFIKSLSEKNEQIAASVANILTTSIANVVSKFQDEIRYLVEIRAEHAQWRSLSWHTDHIGTKVGYGHSTILPLKGPHTLFCPHAEVVDRGQGCRGNITNSTYGQGDVFFPRDWGIPGATHSHPATREARLLVLIRP